MKKGISFVLGLGLILGAVASPAYVLNVYADDEIVEVPEAGDVMVSSWAELKEALAEGGSVVLDADIEDNDEGYVIGKTVTIDLNGHTLNIGTHLGSKTEPQNGVFDVKGEDVVLTIDDQSEVGNGEIHYKPTGTTAPFTIQISGGAKVVLNGGTVYAPNGKSGGGNAVLVKTGGLFEMNGGAIVSPDEVVSGANYGVQVKYGDGRAVLNAGRIATLSDAVFVNNSTTVSAEINEGMELTSTNGYPIDAAKGDVEINGVTVSSIKLGANVTLDSVTVTGNAAISGGNVTLRDTTIDGTTTITGGNTVVSDGTALADIVYESNYNASLTIEEGANIGDLEQRGKAFTPSFTDATTGEKVYGSYSTYGSLVIAGGVFEGEVVLPTPEDIAEANAGRAEYEAEYNERSGKSPIASFVPANTPEIYGGTFIEEPEAAFVADDLIAGIEDEAGVWRVIDPEQAIDEDLIVIDGEDGNKHIVPIVIDEVTIVPDEESGVTATMAAFIAGELKALVNGDVDEAMTTENVKLISPWDAATLRRALAQGETLRLQLVNAKYDGEFVKINDEFYADLIEQGAIREGEVIIGAYGVSFAITNGAGDSLVGWASNVGESVKLEFEISELPEVADGFERNFYAIRWHQGPMDDEQIITRLDATVTDNILSTENDLFSDFLLTYEDTEKVEAPDTGVFTADGTERAQSVNKLFVLLVAVGLFSFGFRLIQLGRAYREIEK